MREKKTPQEKKRLSLEHDHPLQAEYSHRFRKSWPLKKRSAQKSLRTKVNQELASGTGTSDLTGEERLDPARHRRKRVKKWGSSALEVIRYKRERRARAHRRKKDAHARHRAAQDKGP